ncbi:MAG: mechanosensitive ion channel domain-containing protein [Pseudomonadota bacterium]
MSHTLTELTPHHWSLITILAATLLAHFFARVFLKRIEKIAANTDTVWDDVFVASAKKPLPVFIWLSGLFTAVYAHYTSKDQALPALVAHTGSITLTLCVAWFFFSFIRHSANGVIARQKSSGYEVDMTTVAGLSKIGRVTVVVLAGLTIIQSLGFSISGVLAFGGIGGIAIGFAAKDFLANWLGGLILHIDRPFKLGESIRSPDKQIEGQVEYIGWRQTALRSRNMDMIYVPNSLFNSIVLVNLTRRSHRRIEENIELRFTDLPKVAAICEEAQTMLRTCNDIDNSKEIIVALNGYSATGVNLTLQAFTLGTSASEFAAVKHAVLLELAEIIRRHGADFAGTSINPPTS